MSSPSLPSPPFPPPPPPPTGAFSGSPSPGPPPTGAPPPPPPPPPPSPSNTSTANYFFGFIITFVILLLLFVGCGIGSWRRFRLVGTALDERLQDMDGTSFGGRRRGRRRFVRPVFWETRTCPEGLTALVPGPSEKGKWEDMQPISAACVWSRSKSKSGVRSRKSGADASAQTAGPEDDGSLSSVGATLWSFIFPRRPHCNHPPRPPPVERPPPEAIQVAVMIAMPSPPSQTPGGGPSYVGHSGVREYQIGVVRIPWS